MPIRKKSTTRKSPARIIRQDTSITLRKVDNGFIVSEFGPIRVEPVDPPLEDSY